MTTPEFWTHSSTAVFHHLWQSTAVAFLAWLLTATLRNNSARVRYAIWFFASIKFLVPFSLLTSLDARIDATNLLNHPVFRSWNTIVGNAQFGLPQSPNQMRSLQATFRVRF